MIDDAILAQAEALLQRCRRAGLRVATAESCTGGLIAATLTAIPGSSDVLERGFVTYSNAAKTALVGVPAAMIETHGAVSEAVAAAMAEGALANSPADLAVAVTGIAGPGGAGADKKLGLVWFGCCRRGQLTRTLRMVFPGDRTSVRKAAVAKALTLLDQAVA
jgi:nicotinamide-nucleotide amidase